MLAPLSRRGATFLVTALLATTLAALPSARASADELGGRPVPAVWDVSPQTGGIVQAGEVYVAGSALATNGVQSAQISIDGAPVDTRITTRTDVAARAVATPALAAGDYLATMTFVAGDGTEHRRDWRFTVTDVSVRRLDGPDRVATAATIARAGRDPNAAPAAVLARADDFADALAGAPLAHHVAGPLLLTASDELSPAAADALRDLVEEAGTVYLLGGAGALSPEVASAVSALGLDVERLHGGDRFATAAAVAARLPEDAAAYVASGSSFPDALAVAGPAAVRGRPILLTASGDLPDATRAALAGRPAATIVGGEAVVSAGVADAIGEVVPDVGRIGGADRFDTARKVAERLAADSTTVSLTNGLGFADALAGAVDVAAVGGAMLLTHPDLLPEPTRAHLAAARPDALRLYGGTAAVNDSVANMALGAMIDTGPRLESVDPGFGTELHNLDQIRLTFADELEVRWNNVSVWFDGRELPTSWATGDFDNTIVVTLGALPFDPPLHEPLPLRIVGQFRTDDGWRHVDHTYTFRKIAMSRGDSGPEVHALQQRLVDLGYWLGTPDATYGSLTVQAIMAFQKYERLPVTGIADQATQNRLAVAQRPRGQSSSGAVVEVDKTRQVLMIVRDGVATWTFNTSTGTEQRYNDDGHSGVADTPPGRFRVCHQVDGMREAPLGQLWRPKYFHCGDGIAVHGAANVPSYPASHGCVRVTFAAMDFIWANDYMPMGSSVLVYGRYPGT